MGGGSFPKLMLPTDQRQFIWRVLVWPAVTIGQNAGAGIGKVCAAPTIPTTRRSPPIIVPTQKPDIGHPRS